MYEYLMHTMCSVKCLHDGGIHFTDHYVLWLMGIHIQQLISTSKYKNPKVIEVKIQKNEELVFIQSRVKLG